MFKNVTGKISRDHEGEGKSREHWTTGRVLAEEDTGDRELLQIKISLR